MRQSERQVVVWCLQLDTVPDEAWPALEGAGASDSPAITSGRPGSAAARTLARHLLASVTATSPGQWHIGRLSSGAPVVQSAISASASLHISLSRTRGAIAAGVTAAGPLGIDIEHVDEAHDADGIARALFAPRDRIAMTEVADPREGFLAVWTLKEAALKALGVGFALAPDRVALLGLDPPRIGFAPDSSAEARGWHLQRASHGPFRVATACRTGTEERLASRVTWVRVAPCPVLAFEAAG